MRSAPEESATCVGLLARGKRAGGVLVCHHETDRLAGDLRVPMADVFELDAPAVRSTYGAEERRNPVEKLEATLTAPEDYDLSLGKIEYQIRPGSGLGFSTSSERKRGGRSRLATARNEFLQKEVERAAIGAPR